jgi:hypothetical protein
LKAIAEHTRKRGSLVQTQKAPPAEPYWESQHVKRHPIKLGTIGNNGEMDVALGNAADVRVRARDGGQEWEGTGLKFNALKDSRPEPGGDKVFIPRGERRFIILDIDFAGAPDGIRELEVLISCSPPLND